MAMPELHDAIKTKNVASHLDHSTQRKRRPVANDLEGIGDEMRRSGVQETDIFHILPGNFFQEYDWRMSLVEGMGREPTITVPARLGAGFTHSFEEVLVHVAPQQHEQMIEHALDILKFINVHVVADNEMVGLAVRQPGRPEYDLPFKITQKGYDLHPSYTRTTGMVTHSGGLVMGKGPYYMSEIDHHSKFPHTILTSVGEITPDQEAMPENTVRVGIIAGMKINGSFDEIKKELFDPNMLYLLREGLLEDQQRPKKISSFVRIFELPERKK